MDDYLIETRNKILQKENDQKRKGGSKVKKKKKQQELLLQTLEKRTWKKENVYEEKEIGSERTKEMISCMWLRVDFNFKFKLFKLKVLISSL